MALEGGCLCGALRYRCEVAPVDTGYCHCRLCQRSTGAPALAWASVPVEHFAYTKGRPTHYASSSHGRREFCNVCGTQIAFREQVDATLVDVNVGSLDEPGAAPPRRHVWTSSRIAWFETADTLPRHEEGEDGS